MGYLKDYYVDRKYIGTIVTQERDREVFGVYGAIEEVLKEDLIIGKKKIKKGTTVRHELNIFCGKMK